MYIALVHMGLMIIVLHEVAFLIIILLIVVAEILIFVVGGFWLNHLWGEHIVRILLQIRYFSFIIFQGGVHFKSNGVNYITSYVRVRFTVQSKLKIIGLVFWVSQSHELHFFCVGFSRKKRRHFGGLRKK